MVLNDHARIHNKRLHGDHVWNPDGVLNFYSGISFARNVDSVPFWMSSFYRPGSCSAALCVLDARYRGNGEY